MGGRIHREILLPWRPGEAPLHFRGDPSRVEWPRSPDGVRVTRTPWSTIDHCLRAPESRLKVTQSEHTPYLPKDLDAYVRGLCRQVEPTQWESIYAGFLEALRFARSHRPAKWLARDEHLSEGWHRSPWLYLRGARPWGDDSGRALLDRIRASGFRNIALLSCFHRDAVGAGVFDQFLEAARVRRLRIVAGIDFAHHLGGRGPVSGADRALIADLVFSVLAREVDRGVAGVRAHGIEEWLAPPSDTPHPRPRATWALHRLIKTFLRLVAPEEVLIPEPHRFDPKDAHLALGEVQLGGRAVAAGADLLPWHDGILALRESLAGSNRQPFETVLRQRPHLGHGSESLLALEWHDRGFLGTHPKTRQGWRQLLGDHPGRALLALGCLYFAPAVPAVYGDPERPPEESRWLRRLNRIHRDAAPHRFRAVPLADERTLAWVRTADDDRRIVWTANLGAAPARIRLDGDALELGAGEAAACERLAGQPVREGADGSIEIELPAFGFSLLRLHPATIDASR